MSNQPEAPVTPVEAYEPPYYAAVFTTVRTQEQSGYSETNARGYLERNSTACAAWKRDYDQLMVESLSTVASLAMISTVRKGLQ